MIAQTWNTEFKTMNENFSELSVFKKAGGSLVTRPPVFSKSGKQLLVALGNCVRSYNTETAGLLSNYNGLSNDVVGVALHPFNLDNIVAVSCSGEFIEWDLTSRNSIIRKMQLGEGREKLTIRSFFLLPHHEETFSVACIVAKKNKALLKVFSSDSGKEETLIPDMRVDNLYQSVAFRYFQGETLLAAFCNGGKPLLQFSISHSLKTTTTAVHANRMTCVACHPTEHCVITGDIIGCIKVWRNLLSEPVSAIYHWHTLPVQTLAFSQSGSYFYSGGGECVLVQWLLDSSQRRFLPRLGAEIVHISVSPENTYLALSTRENAIYLVDSLLNIVSTILHFSWTTVPAGKQADIPHELLHDPRSQSLVTNGRVGHLQFLSLEQESVLFLLDVVCQNYLTQERFKVIKNTDVVKFAFSADGSWLATVEFCEGDEKTPIELRLKFWKYNEGHQRYVLNTSVENPHRGRVNAIEFRPSANNESLMCVTTGEDSKFYTWTLNESTSTHREGHFWHSENVGFFRDLPVGTISFSSDGSLLAVAFGPTLTIWVPGSNELKCSLTRPDSNQHLSHVEFGRGNCIHLVITGSSIGIAVWNLLSLSLMFIVQFNLAVLVSDPYSDLVAAFSHNNDLVIFSPNCPEPIYKQNCLLEKEKSCIVNAVFIPHSPQKNSHVIKHTGSHLYFLNSKQELFGLEQPSLHTDSSGGRILDVLPEESYQPKTAYAALLAQQRQTDVMATKNEIQKHIGIPGFKTLREVVDAPAHVMPLTMVGYSLLLSFISRREERLMDVKENSTEDEKVNHSDTNEFSDDNSDEDQTAKPTQEERKGNLTDNFQSTSLNVEKIERGLLQFKKKSLDWVSNLLI